jgi:uncharacterized protein YyaL (SSP411 family)
MEHSNRLIHETSPYLLQHAHNPVDWYPWGEEALQKAKNEDRPILVSIGYSACHWCHVMERESFENEETAKLMNDYFINIKIDREERPDLDHIYMDAVQAMTGSGGWPLNVFLTPDAKPFFGGTYFPPSKAFNRSSWTDVLQNIHQAYKERRDEIESQANNMIGHLANSNSFGKKANQEETPTVFTQENVDLIAINILKQADTEWGGFGNAPKFPQTFSIQFLLRHYHFTKDENALNQALLSLDKMIYGGIYDQVGGGFARYSTDAKWLAPHFEKMLYDNALLIGVLSEAYQLTKKELYAETIAQTINFIQREMLSNENGFYSALDADSEGVEGKFYTWSKQEIDQLLGEDATIFCEVYNIAENGNWEHTNILWITETVENIAARKSIGLNDLKKVLERSRQKLLQQRENRIRPQLDDKILLGWNALMNTACSKAYAALGVASYKQIAIDNMLFMEQRMASNGSGYHHTYKNGLAKIPAFLDDYAYLIQAYIHLQEITGEGGYLLKAKELARFVLENFQEEQTGYFFYTSKGQTDIVVRKKEVYDGATPSGNAVMAANLQYLSIVFEETSWRDLSLKIVESLGTAIVRYPTSFGVWASIVQQNVAGINEMVIVGEEFTQTLPTVLSAYVPNKILQSSNMANEKFPLLRTKSPVQGICYYLCRDYVCREAETDVEVFLANM